MNIVTIRLKPSVKKKLQLEAKRQCLTVSQFLRKMIFEKLKLDVRKSNDVN